MHLCTLTVKGDQKVFFLLLCVKLLFSYFQRWCKGFSPHGFNVSVTTNNGTEAMNNSLKSFYLKISGTKTVSSLVEIIVTEFIPEQLLSYAKLNYMYSSEHKVYSANVPLGPSKNLCATLPEKPRGSLLLYLPTSSRAE